MTNPPIQMTRQFPQLTTPEDLKPVYANMVRIAHMPSEIIFDFALKVPGQQAATIMSRVMMSPLSAKLLHRALSENLGKYEAAFGEIKFPGEGSLKEYTKLFRPPQPPKE
ncbi:MAG: DUF3467 domain-containing protein [Anaerolineales bacterium]